MAIYEARRRRDNKYKQYYNKCKEDGICVNCKKPLDRKGVRCKACNERVNKRCSV